MVTDVVVSSPRWSVSEWTEFSRYIQSNAERLPAATRAGLLRVSASAPEPFRSDLLRMLGAPDASTAADLLDTLRAHADRCVGMAANMIGSAKRIRSSAFRER